VENLLGCGVKLPNPPKSDISIKVTNTQTGEDASSDFTMNVQMPPGTDCPSGCSKDGSKCSCGDLSIFNPKEQISQLFKNSEIGTLINYQLLANWKFYESFAFWTVLFTVGVYFLSIPIVVCYIPKLCLLKVYRKKRSVSKCKSASTSLLVNYIITHLTN